MYKISDAFSYLIQIFKEAIEDWNQLNSCDITTKN